MKQTAELFHSKENKMKNTLSINRLIVIIATAGFLFLLVDTILEHLDAFKDEALAYVPVVFSIVGLVVAGVAAFRWDEMWIKLLHWCFIAAFAVGVVGVYLHVAGQFESEEERIAEHGESKKEEKAPPPLAPLAFAGLGAVGMLGTLRKWQAEVKEA